MERVEFRQRKPKLMPLCNHFRPRIKRRRRSMRTWFICVGLLSVASAAPLLAGGGASQIIQGDVVLKDFKFQSGESLPEIRMHYRTLGQPKADEQGIVRNAVLVVHGTGGDGGSLMNAKMFAGELFG